jgi:uncharacterized protein (TIGR03083 family)
MPEPTTKEGLLQEIHAEREALEKFLAGLAPEQMVQPGALGEWSVKDMLAHLAEWEQLLLVWYNAGLRGEVPPLPAVGYHWDQMDDLNQVIFEKYRDWTLEDMQAYFQDSYRQTLEAVRAMTEEELFTPGRYRWTKQNTLADYVIPCTSEHYQWALAEMGGTNDLARPTQR